MELEIKNGKVWILENKENENEIERYAYDDERSAMGRVKQLLKSVDAQKLFLSTIDITGKEWQISGVPMVCNSNGYSQRRKSTKSRLIDLRHA